MKNLNLTTGAFVGAVAIAASAVATPALAHPPVVQYPATCQSMYPNAQCRDRGLGNPGRYYGYVPPAVYNSGGPGYRSPALAYHPVAGPLNFAGGVVGAAVGTAGAIATAPFRSEPWDGSYYHRY